MKSSKSTNYFNRETEHYVKQFHTASTEDREFIFYKHLYHPLLKLVENILFTYRLYLPSEDIASQKQDALSFLMTKVHKFNPSRIGATGQPVKAYSYFGTIAKRYLIAKREKFQKEQRSMVREKPPSWVEQDGGFLSSGDHPVEYAGVRIHEEETVPDFLRDGDVFNETLGIFVEFCNAVIMTGDTAETRVKLADSLAQIFSHADKLPVVNKNFVYFLIRDQHSMKAKEITAGLKEFKRSWFAFKQHVIAGAPPSFA